MSVCVYCCGFDIYVCVVERCSNNSQWEQISVWSLWWQHQERKRWRLSSPALDSNWPSISSSIANTHAPFPISIATHTRQHPVRARAPNQFLKFKWRHVCHYNIGTSTDTQHTHCKHHHRLNNRWRLKMTGQWQRKRGVGGKINLIGLSLYRALSPGSMRPACCHLFLHFWANRLSGKRLITLELQENVGNVDWPQEPSPEPFPSYYTKLWHHSCIQWEWPLWWVLTVFQTLSNQKEMLGWYNTVEFTSPASSLTLQQSCS